MGVQYAVSPVASLLNTLIHTQANSCMCIAALTGPSLECDQKEIQFCQQASAQYQHKKRSSSLSEF